MSGQTFSANLKQCKSNVRPRISEITMPQCPHRNMMLPSVEKDEPQSALRSPCPAFPCRSTALSVVVPCVVGHHQHPTGMDTSQPIPACCQRPKQERTTSDDEDCV